MRAYVCEASLWWRTHCQRASGMFVQRKYERDNDTQAYLQRKNERNNAIQAYIQRKGERENAGYRNVTLAMVTVTFHFLWNRSPALPSFKELRSKKFVEDRGIPNNVILRTGVAVKNFVIYWYIYVPKLI